MDPLNENVAFVQVTGENGEHIVITAKEYSFLINYHNASEKKKKIVDSILTPYEK